MYKTVLVTGATGLVGTQVLQSLLARDPEVRIRAVYHQSPPAVQDPRIAYRQADLRQPEALGDWAAGCDAAILCAAHTGGAKALLNEAWRQVTDNLCLQAQLFQALAQAGVKRTLFISSAIVYHASETALREDDLDLNLEPHPAHFGIAWVLRSLEQLCEFWHRQTGMEFVIVRAANIFGPYDRFDPERSNFVPALIRKAVDQMDPFEVWGRPDVVRDIIYVTDFVAGLLALLEADEVGVEVFNLGSGQRTTVADVVKCVTDCAGFQPSSVSYDLSQPATSRARVLNCDKIHSWVGWTPEYGIQEGLQRTLDWWQNNKMWWNK